jgi:alpha-1,2-glucosyltransferase
MYFHQSISRVGGPGGSEQVRLLQDPLFKPDSPSGATQSLLQTMVLPLALIPTLLPSPLLEPRYFVVPYILLRLQVHPYDEAEPLVHVGSTADGAQPKVVMADAQRKGLNWADYLPWIELVWYCAVNYTTMYVFLYMDRVVGVNGRDELIRFMW